MSRAFPLGGGGGGNTVFKEDCHFLELQKLNISKIMKQSKKQQKHFGIKIAPVKNVNGERVFHSCVIASKKDFLREFCMLSSRLVVLAHLPI